MSTRVTYVTYLTYAILHSMFSQANSSSEGIVKLDKTQLNFVMNLLKVDSNESRGLAMKNVMDAIHDNVLSLESLCNLIESGLLNDEEMNMLSELYVRMDEG